MMRCGSLGLCFADSDFDIDFDFILLMQSLSLLLLVVVIMVTNYVIKALFLFAVSDCYFSG